MVDRVAAVTEARPFKPGNQAAVTHGAFVARRVDPRATELAATAVAALPWLDEPAFRRALLAWARAEARCDLLAEYLEREGLLDDEGRPRPAVQAAATFERQAAEARRTLGLDPTSRVRLERDMAEAGLGRERLNAALDEGRRLRAVRDGRAG